MGTTGFHDRPYATIWSPKWTTPIIWENARPVLILIDVQKAIDASYHAAHGPRNNIDAEMKIAQVLTAWRKHQCSRAFL